MFTLRWIWWAQPAMSSSGGGESKTVVSNNYIGTGPQCLAKLFCCEALHPVHTKDTIVFFAPFLFVVAYLSFWLLPVSSDDNFCDRWAKWDNQSHPPQLLSQSLLKKEKLVGHWLIFSQNLTFSFAFLDEQMCILVFTWWWFSNLIRQRKLMSTPLHRLIHPGVNWIKQTMASGNDGDVEKRNLPKKIVNISFWEDITRKRVSFHSQPMPQPKLMALF